MKNAFSLAAIHPVTEANINYYAEPFVHPKRCMQEHDFIYLLQGEWKIGQDSEVYTLKENTILILTAGNTHYGVCPCQPGTKTMYFHVNANPGDKLISDAASTTCNYLHTDICMDVSEQGKIKELFAKVVNCKLSGEQRKADLYFELLLCALSENRNSGNNTGIIDKIIKIIHANPECAFGNKELAAMVNVSVKTAETRFKAVTGKTIHQYILEYKIKQAISYFNIFPEVSIKQTAHNLGFYDEYHFSKQFKRLMGMSPKQYRQQMHND